MLKWQVGDVRITQLVELTSESIGAYLLPDATPERMRAIPWMAPFLNDDGTLVLSFHSLILETRESLVIVDTCIGNDKVRSYPRWNMMQGDFLERLAAAGFEPDRFDTVLCTHMHVDHVGWNTRLVDGAWQPTFGNARYLYAQSEWDHHRDLPADDMGPIIEDSVQPIFDAGLADLVAGDHQITDEVRLEPTPGHTPGHVSVHVSSRGEEAIITGDLMHHPCQIVHPDWPDSADWDKQLAVRTRADFIERYADRPVLVIGTHFAGPTAGRIVSDGDTYRLDY